MSVLLSSRTAGEIRANVEVACNHIMIYRDLIAKLPADKSIFTSDAGDIINDLNDLISNATLLRDAIKDRSIREYMHDRSGDPDYSERDEN